jgi:hypothetical protein
VLLRYTGPGPVLFTSIGLEVAPGDEFEVPDEGAEAFTRRADIEAAAPERPAKAKRAARTDAVQAAAPDPAGDSATPAGPVPDPTAAQ